MRLGVDFSQWGGPLAPATIACWKGQGVTHAVVQYSSLMPQHLEALAQGGGIEAEAYVYLYWGQDPWGQTPQTRTRQALAMAQGRIRRLWLDAEDSTHPFQPGQLLECVRICEQAGVEPGIYTGRWWWVPQTNNSTAFAHLPLWHAEYLGQAPAPDLSRLPQDFSGFQPYGGWQRPAIWQWWNTTQLCGHSVDLNAIPEEDDDMDEADERELAHRRAKAILDFNTAVNYRLRYTDASLSKIELLTTDYQPTGIIVPVAHPPIQL